jgi:cytochrome c556
MRDRRRPLWALHWLAVAALAATFVVPAARAQDLSAATPKDAIFARKTLMDAIGTDMDEITTLLGAAKFDLEKGHGFADAISVMLMAFPHLFPPATNQFKEGATRDPATDTFASPDVWKTFGDFYQRSAATSKAAFTASRADTEAAFKAAAAELQKGCDGCHAAYLKIDP